MYLDILSFRELGSSTNQYMVVAKFKEKLSESKYTMTEFHKDVYSFVELGR